MPTDTDTTVDDDAPTTDLDPGTDPPATGETDWAAEAEKWKQQARKNEERAKANAKAARELEDLKKSTMSDTEKAIAEAEARGRQAAVADVAQRLAAAEIRAALTGVVPDPSVIVEDLNLARYVTDTGDVDSDAVAKLRAKYEGIATKPKTGQPAGTGDGGHRGGPPAPAQLTRADVERLAREGKHDEINKARAEGRLNEIMGITP